ncbi:hypothetical protein ACFUN7_23855 [Streptomyces sp. NPDC057236]|uniref:hypothetical protein n=1 Tax=Streptomyces sp. NPDC057236 TaxID=3346059 RepID=UPI003643CBD9
MTDALMGPPRQMDRRLDAPADRDRLPGHAWRMVDEARAELVTAKDPFFRGIDADAGLPKPMYVEPVRSTDPKGPHVLHFDDHRGWLIHTFVPRTEDPRIIVEEIFWQ